MNTTPPAHQKPEEAHTVLTGTGIKLLTTDPEHIRDILQDYPTFLTRMDDGPILIDWETYVIEEKDEERTALNRLLLAAGILTNKASKDEAVIGVYPQGDLAHYEGPGIGKERLYFTGPDALEHATYFKDQVIPVLWAREYAVAKEAAAKEGDTPARVVHPPVELYRLSVAALWELILDVPARIEMV